MRLKSILSERQASWMIRPRAKLRRGELTRKQKEAVRRLVFERDGYKCQECGAGVLWEAGDWHSGHLAHIRSRGLVEAGYLRTCGRFASAVTASNIHTERDSLNHAHPRVNYCGSP